MGGVFSSEPPTQEHVVLKDYQGTWYELAKYPFSWEPSGAHDTTATYTLAADGSMTIVNCQTIKDGGRVCSRGKAEPMDDSDAKLEVSFESPSRSDSKSKDGITWTGPPFPTTGDYWILETDYKTYSLVGHPQRKHLWILARQPSISAYEYGKLLKRLQRVYGYDTRRLVMTRHTHNLTTS